MEITVHRVTSIKAVTITHLRETGGDPFYVLNIELLTSDGHDLTVKAFSDDLGALKIDQPS